MLSKCARAQDVRKCGGQKWSTSSGRLCRLNDENESRSTERIDRRPKEKSTESIGETRSHLTSLRSRSHTPYTYIRVICVSIHTYTCRELFVPSPRNDHGTQSACPPMYVRACVRTSQNKSGDYVRRIGEVMMHSPISIRRDAKYEGEALINPEGRSLSHLSDRIRTNRQATIAKETPSGPCKTLPNTIGARGRSWKRGYSAIRDNV